VAIFLPVAFMSGVIGKFFFQFGITISSAVLLSLLEAITLIPMRCASFMETRQQSSRMARFLDSAFERLSNVYRVLLMGALKARWPTLILAIALFVGSLSFVSVLRKEFIPSQDQSVFLMRFQTPVGNSLEATSRAASLIEKYASERSDVIRYFTAIGGFGGGEVNTGMFFVTLKPRSERAESQAAIMNEFREDLKEIPDLRVFIQDLSQRGFTAQRGFPVEFNIRGPDWVKLKEYSDIIVEKLGLTQTVVDIDTDYRLGQPEVQVLPLRNQAAARGVSIETIADTVSAAIGGVRVGKFTNGGRRYDARIRLEADERNQPKEILDLEVRNTHGELVPIKEVIEIKEVDILQTITRRNRERSISVFANVAPGQSQAAVLSQIQELGDKVLPETYRLFLGGGASTFVESFESLYFVLWLGVLVAYMLLASQFNSFIHPITVLLSLPFSVTGALAALYLFDQSLNLYSLIGIVLLMGIVKKNAILLVEFANSKRYHDGLGVKEALLAAGPIRLRPILMTSCATIAAALPPALAFGPGAESRIPMSIAIVGGVLVSSLFTLFVVPAAYSILSRLESPVENTSDEGFWYDKKK
ncbi:MAG: efflux RND transporter permease subunit, partial [Bdellovibrionales bacterium]|nr:efflux RND transporter permease subunit [Bdellovibrionales bacterium]